MLYVHQSRLTLRTRLLSLSASLNVLLLLIILWQWIYSSQEVRQSYYPPNEVYCKLIFGPPTQLFCILNISQQPHSQRWNTRQ